MWSTRVPGGVVHEEQVEQLETSHHRVTMTMSVCVHVCGGGGGLGCGLTKCT